MAKKRNKQAKRNSRPPSTKTRIGRDFIPLASHERKGNVLHTPWTSYLNTTPSSWARERLPEMLWAVLAISASSRDLGLALFRRLIRLSTDICDVRPKSDIMHTALAEWPDAPRAEFFKAISEWPDSVPCLRPLLLFPDLPLAEQWRDAIGAEPEDGDWDYLMFAVAKALWHQSEQATDCRWARVMFQLGCGRMKFPKAMEGELHDLNNYPRQGDLRRLRPTIRATEMAIDQMVDRTSGDWAHRFWERCHRQTPCSHPDSHTPSLPHVGTTTQRVTEVRAALVEHAASQERSTGIDAKHNAVFGSGLFALGILEELLGVGNGGAILGRLGLRTIVDAYITLSYLVAKDTEELALPGLVWLRTAA